MGPIKACFICLKKTAYQLRDFLKVFASDANEMKLLWSALSQDKLEFLFPVTILYYYLYFFLSPLLQTPAVFINLPIYAPNKG